MMTTIEGLFLICFYLSIFLIPLSILAWFFEETPIGRTIMDWVLKKLGIDPDDWDD